MLKNERGFTLVEMLIVMLVITVLLLLIIPNITKQSKHVNDKGCEALIQMVQAQTDAYYFVEAKYPTIAELKSAEYITEDQMSCTNKSTLIINDKGKVKSTEND